MFFTSGCRTGRRSGGSTSTPGAWTSAPWTAGGSECGPLARRSPTWTSCASLSWTCLAGTALCRSGREWAWAPLMRRGSTAWTTGSSQRRPTARAPPSGATVSSVPMRASGTTKPCSCARSAPCHCTTTASRKLFLCRWFYFFFQLRLNQYNKFFTSEFEKVKKDSLWKSITIFHIPVCDWKSVRTKI